MGSAHFRTRRDSSQPLRDSAAPCPGPAPFRMPPRLCGARPRRPPRRRRPLRTFASAPSGRGGCQETGGRAERRVSAPLLSLRPSFRDLHSCLRPPAERARMAEVRSQRPLLCRLSFDPSPSSLFCYPVSHPPIPNSPSVSILSPPTTSLPTAPPPVPVGAGSIIPCPSFHWVDTLPHAIPPC